MIINHHKKRMLDVERRSPIWRTLPTSLSTTVCRCSTRTRWSSWTTRASRAGRCAPNWLAASRTSSTCANCTASASPASYWCTTSTPGPGSCRPAAPSSPTCCSSLTRQFSHPGRSTILPLFFSTIVKKRTPRTQCKFDTVVTVALIQLALVCAMFFENPFSISSLCGVICWATYISCIEMSIVNFLRLVICSTYSKLMSH